MFGCQYIWALGIIYEVVSASVSQTPESTILMAGSDMTFHCTASPVLIHSHVDVYWWKLGNQASLQPDSDGRKRFFPFTNGATSFQILNVRVPDSGFYYCGVRDSGNEILNGTGSKLVVHASPEPIRLIPKVSPINTSALSLVCEAAEFYPESLTFTWYKNDSNIVTGISTIQKVNSEGTYEASSILKTTGPAESGIVYTCVVFHLTLQDPAVAVYYDSISNSDHEPTPIYLQISGYTGAALIFLTLGAFILMSYKLT
ncbi:H-2 class II histocompatibility antigen, E-D beta chain-like isoform X2 [Scyliorhinus canicula]|uniref:H-2 class II histocompatibility antigen, E-D beta chain-like isoform X2 n=1 Tax=Scyliorhinus canicula TaxID=7830 RepID=UPI0018F70DD2|nr:H-2 class II histocompatibility antigen, E-D beta chain-like isoform X2 [Scyliorhinus canicula]